MPKEYFDGLLISSPNGGGLFYCVGDTPLKLDSHNTTGMFVSRNGVGRGFQPKTLHIYGHEITSLNGVRNNFDDIHDICLDGDGVYVVGTSGNEIVKFDLKGVECSRWTFPGERDSWHINCLCLWNDEVFFSAFGDFRHHREYKGASASAGFVQNLETGNRIISGLSQPHSLVPSGENLLLANSESMELREYGRDGQLLRAIKLGGYVRGIAEDNGIVYVGLSKTRNVSDQLVARGTVVALDRNTWKLLARMEIPANEIYGLTFLKEGGESAKVLARMFSGASTIYDEELASIATELQAQAIQLQGVQEKAAAVENRLSQTISDFTAEIDRIVAERDSLLGEKDVAWAARVEQVAQDYAGEIERIAIERDELLRQKDAAWEGRLMQAQSDLDREVARIAAERDAMLRDKDVVWAARVAQTEQDFSTEIERIAIERDDLLQQKDSVWADRLATVVSDTERLALDCEKKIYQMDVRHAAEIARLQRWQPKISVITVNFNGAHFLPGLINSLREQTLTPHEIIVVDNASTDESIAILDRDYPEVKVIKSDVNLGFAAGNNLGVSKAKSPFVALINNDTVVASDWLDALADSWARYSAEGGGLGAVSPKIRFFRKFLKFDFVAERCFSPPGDSRVISLALDMSHSRIVGCDYVKPIVLSGFYGEERWPGSRVVRWIDREASLLLPAPDDAHIEELSIQLVFRTLDGVADQQVSVYCEGRPLGAIVAGADFATKTLSIPQEVRRKAAWVINNAGTNLDGLANAADIGINVRDEGQFDTARSVDAFCGCSVLFSKSTFERLGGFDERLFMYYEDADLSWRMRNSNFRIIYEPRAVVYHIHAGSSGEWSPTFRYRVTRNQRIVALKNAEIRLIPGVVCRMIVKALLSLWQIGATGYVKAVRGNIQDMSPDEIHFKALHEAILSIPRLLAGRLLKKNIW